MHSTIMHPELQIQHDGKAFTAILGKHVDVVKISGRCWNVSQIVNKVEKVFGKVTSSMDADDQISDFVNCGVRHQRLKDDSVSMD